MTLPLEGIRVLDVTQAWAGPFATQLLADVGADVIKVEPPSGDHVRHWTTAATEGLSPHFLAANRNKRSIAIDLKTSQGREIILDLARESDIFIENFRPGVAARLGIGYDEISAANDKIIYCSVSGFGQDGPYRDKTAYDIIVQAEGGAMSVTGEQGGRPVKPGIAQGDIMGAFTAAFAMMAALQGRQRTGKGCYLDIAMLDAQLLPMSMHLIVYAISGQVSGPEGTHHQLVAPYGSFRTADGEMIIGVTTDKQFAALCSALEMEELISDPRFESNAARVANRDELIQVLESRLVEKTSSQWEQLLSAQGIPCAPINTADRVFNHPQLRARGAFWDTTAYDGRPITLPGPLFRAPGITRPSHLPPPSLGEHTDEILTQVLGYDSSRVQELKSAGVVG